MDLEEFLRWAAYFEIEPPFEDRSDVHAAMLLAQQHNMNRKKGHPARSIEDFLPRWVSSEKTEMTVDQMEVVLKSHFLARGGDPRQLQ